MKRRIPIIFAAVMALSSCGPKPHNPSASSPGESEESSAAEIISLDASLETTDYVVGETLDYQHLSAQLVKSDQTSLDVGYADFAANNIGVELYDSSNHTIDYTAAFDEAGDYSLSVFLRGVDGIDDSIEISVEPATPKVVESISILFEKTSYYEFETLDLSSLSIAIHYDDDSESTVAYAQFGEYGFTVTLLDSSAKEVALNSELAIGSYKLVVANGDGTIKDEKAISVIEEDFGTIGDEALENLSNAFAYADGKYTANEARSLILFDDYFDKGTYQAAISRGGNAHDDHLIFAYNPTDHSYYSYGLNLANKLQITYFDGAKLSLVKAMDEVVATPATLAVAFDQETGAVDYFLNGDFVYANNIKTVGDLKYGLYAGTKGCVFSQVMKNNDDTLLDNGESNFITAHGDITYSDNAFHVNSSSALSYHKSKTLKYGEVEATFDTTNVTGIVGLAFCIDNNGHATFFREDDISYYYLALTVHGTVGIYRVANKTATLMKNINTKEYYKDREHTLKAVRDLNNTIHAFLDGVYCFSYVDRHPLKGDKFGISASSSGVTYSHFSAKAVLSPTNEDITQFDVPSGSFYQNKDFIVANEPNSLLVYKTPGALNGTIEAEIAMGKNYQTGLVFRLTKPEASHYLQDETGLSYYWLDIKSDNRIVFGKVKNGAVTWSIEKYMPYFMGNASKAKIVLDGNHIYAYYSNVLTFHYVDNDPLTGLYYGFRSDSQGGAIYKGISFASNTEHEQYKYLIFGHSYTQLWHRYREDFAELGTDINNIGIGGSQSIHWSEQYQEEVTCYNPEWGIYWNGINDINIDVPVNTIASRYAACLQFIKQKLPNFKCVVISISRCAHEKSMERVSQIAEANSKIKALCDENDWLVYVDAEMIFCDGEGNPLESNFVDKLHPTPAAYKLVSPMVVDAIKNYGK